MARVVMFLRNELYAGEIVRNKEFRSVVKAFLPLVIEGEYTIEEICCGSDRVEKVLNDNPDCELVFTTENDYHTQYVVSQRGIFTIEWLCFTGKKLVPVIVTKKGDGVFEVNHYKINEKTSITKA